MSMQGQDLIAICVQMSHLETSNQDKLFGTLGGWHIDAKSRGIHYKGKLACHQIAGAENDSDQGQPAFVQLSA